MLFIVRGAGAGQTQSTKLLVVTKTGFYLCFHIVKDRNPRNSLGDATATRLRLTYP